MIRRVTLFTLTLATLSISSYSQTSVSELAGQENVISTAVPFLTITPNSRSGAMGDAGAALSPDVNSLHWNPAKYAFIEDDMGVSFSYTPWLRNLVGDMDLAYLTGFKRIDKQQVIAASLLYFSLGDIEFTDGNGVYQSTAKPNEFAVDAAYSRMFGEKFSGGIAFRFIRSDLSNGYSSDGSDAKAGTSFAADISAFYTDKVKISDYNGKMSYGIDISNIGNKMTYTKTSENKDFLPTNLRLGGSLSLDIDQFNSFTATLDLNKLLIPTPPKIVTESDGTVDTVGVYSDASVLTGIFQSFSDAPGGFKEELHEISYAGGVEYLYKKQFAIRAGYFNEHQTKGNRKYFTAGLGIRFNVFGVDFSYLIPQTTNSPLANTLRFSLNFNFDAFRKVKNKS
jgi:hypothetical protein